MLLALTLLLVLSKVSGASEKVAVASKSNLDDASNKTAVSTDFVIEVSEMKKVTTIWKSVDGMAEIFGMFKIATFHESATCSIFNLPHL